MQYSLLQFISLLGSVCLFLYGMKVMSEGLQKVAGDRLRNILGAMTKNRVTGVLTGIAITALIQSSSASTVMVVSFVNAGLMTLAQSMAVIFGANFGTIVTSWIISAFSFEFHISDYTIVLLALAVPMLFMKKSNYKSIGEFLIGFSFLFMGLDMISAYVPDLQKNPDMLRFITHYASLGYLSVIIFWAFGLILTMVAQASAATFAITLIMCSQGWVSFELGCAIILGSKIGTTITPILASLSGNLAAKRTAAGTLLYNFFGSIIVLAIFYPFLNLVGDVTSWCIGTNPCDITAQQEAAMRSTTLLNETGGLTAAAQTSLAFGLAMFPTVFNVMNLAIMIWLEILRKDSNTTPPRTQRCQRTRRLLSQIHLRSTHGNLRTRHLPGPERNRSLRRTSAKNARHVTHSDSHRPLRLRLPEYLQPPREIRRNLRPHGD